MGHLYADYGFAMSVRAQKQEENSRLLTNVGAPSTDSFSFSIGPNGHGSFALYFHAKGGGGSAMALLGQWPTIEQAQRMVARIRDRLPQGAQGLPPVHTDTLQDRRAAE